MAWEETTNADAAWVHEVAWIPRDGGAVAIHRLRPRGGADTALLASLAAFARAEAAAAPTDAPAAADLQASNVGGYHGDRDLWWRPEFQASPLPALLGGAVTLAARAEAAALGRAPVTTSADEAWLNCLGPGGWNALHTHPGSSYSARTLCPPARAPTTAATAAALPRRRRAGCASCRTRRTRSRPSSCSSTSGRQTAAAAAAASAASIDTC